MRLHLKTTFNREELPFNYQPILTGVIHKWIGKNNFHDGVSFYSFSWLSGGEATKSGLRFPFGTSFFVSSYHIEFLKKIIEGIQIDPTIANGLAVKEVIIQEDPEFKSEAKFFCASPVFIKRTEDGREVHYTFNEEESSKHLTDTLRTKLKKAGLRDEEVYVEFDKAYPTPKTKVIYYNKIGNKVSLCPVILKGSPEQIAFAWNVGVGNSTGIGFGALK